MNVPRYFLRVHRVTAPLVLVLCLVLSLVPSGAVVAAGENRMYFASMPTQRNLNETFTVYVRTYADSDQTTGTATGSVTYPADKLQFISRSTSNSDYAPIATTPTSGAIAFSASRNPAPSGVSELFMITFKTIGAGSAAIGFTSSSKVNDTTTVYTPATITITNPSPPTSNPKPSSTPKASSTPKPTSLPTISTPDPEPEPTIPVESNTPQTTPDPTGVIDSVSVAPLYTTATISWKVNASSPTTVLSYGTSTANLDKKATVSKGEDGTFTTTITGLTPGLRYMFAITATGSDDKKGNYTSSIPTRGYPVTMTVTENNLPVESGQIKIGSQSWYINSSGKVTLGLAAGDYSGTITTETASLAINLTVKTKTIPTDGSAPESQAVSYNLSSSLLEQGPGSSNSVLTFILVMIGGVVVLGLGFVGFMAYRRHKFESGDDVVYRTASGPSVIIDDGYSWHDEKSQSETPPPPSHVQPETTTPKTQLHNNGVYLNEEEPLDMFEQAKQKFPLPNSDTTPKR